MRVTLHYKHNNHSWLRYRNKGIIGLKLLWLLKRFSHLLGGWKTHPKHYWPTSGQIKSSPGNKKMLQTVSTERLTLLQWWGVQMGMGGGVLPIRLVSRSEYLSKAGSRQKQAGPPGASLSKFRFSKNKILLLLVRKMSHQSVWHDVASRRWAGPRYTQLKLLLRFSSGQQGEPKILSNKEHESLKLKFSLWDTSW